MQLKQLSHCYSFSICIDLINPQSTTLDYDEKLGLNQSATNMSSWRPANDDEFNLVQSQMPTMEILEIQVVTNKKTRNKYETR